MKLYHVSIDTDTLKREFTPRVPELSRKAVEIEDVKTPRICFAETVSGCVSALPKYSREKVIQNGTKFVLYTIDTEDFESEDFISNEKLIQDKTVYDANITKEWWLLKSVSLQGRLCETIIAEKMKLKQDPLLPDVAAFLYCMIYREVDEGYKNK